MADIISDLEVRQILSEYPLTIPLYERVHGFCGDQLTLRRREGVGAECRYGTHSVPIEFEIILGVCPSPSAAISHELLHIDLFQRGFPVRHNMFMTGSWEGCLTALTRYVDDLLNLLDHETFIDEFVEELCIPRRLFVHGTERIGLLGIEYQMRADGPRARGRWALDYVSELIKETRAISGIPEGLLAVARTMFATADSDAAFMQEWLTNGEYRLPRLRRDAVWGLLDHFDIGTPDFWWIRREGSQLVLVGDQDAAP